MRNGGGRSKRRKMMLRDEENEKGQRKTFTKRNKRKDIYMYDIIFYGESCLPVFLTLRKFDPRETPSSKDCDIRIIAIERGQ